MQQETTRPRRDTRMLVYTTAAVKKVLYSTLPIAAYVLRKNVVGILVEYLVGILLEYLQPFPIDLQ